MKAVLFLTSLFVLSVVFWPEAKTASGAATSTKPEPSPAPAKDEEEFRHFEAAYIKYLEKNPPKIVAAFDVSNLAPEGEAAQAEETQRRNRDQENVVVELNDNRMPELSREDEAESADLMKAAGLSSRFVN